MNGHKEEIDGVEGMIYLTPLVLKADSCLDDKILDSIYKMKVGRMVCTTL